MFFLERVKGGVPSQVMLTVEVEEIDSNSKRFGDSLTGM